MGSTSLLEDTSKSPVDTIFMLPQWLKLTTIFSKLRVFDSSRECTDSVSIGYPRRIFSQINIAIPALRVLSSLMLSYGAFSIDPAPSHDSMLSILVRRLGIMASTSDISAADDHWHGAVDVVVAAPVEKVWAIASDWLKFPCHCSVECAEGENGVPGCVRKVQAYDSNFWVAEKLTRIDHTSRILSYDLVGGNTGIEIGYNASFQAVAEGESKTRVVWRFMFRPEQASVESWTTIVKKKVQAHIKELEELAQHS